MALTKVLIAAKTYPALSSKYDELVCTAGFTEDGRWIRIFPIPFRKLEYEQRYKKYDWVEIDLEKNHKDFRPESYKPVTIEREFRTVGHLDTGVDKSWKERKNIVLQNVHRCKKSLIEEAKDKKLNTSLAVFKPKEIKDFIYTPVEREWDKAKLDALRAKANQGLLFQTDENPFDVVQKLPFKFQYIFLDENNISSTLMIEDWELGVLYWKMLAKHEGNEAKACLEVRKKYFDDFAQTKDLYLFLGTTYENHIKNAPNPFVIIGTFHPKFAVVNPQLALF